MFVLSEKTKINVSRNVGLEFNEICNLSSNKEMELLKEKKIKAVFSKNKKSLRVGRGNPYLSRKKFKTIEEVDKAIEHLIKE